MTTATARRALASIARLGVLAALAWAAVPAQAQDLGVMLRFAHAQPGAAVMLAQLRLRQTVAPVAAVPAANAGERRALPMAAAQPALAVTAVAAGAPRPPVVVLR